MDTINNFGKTQIASRFVTHTQTPLVYTPNGNNARNNGRKQDLLLSSDVEIRYPEYDVGEESNDFDLSEITIQFEDEIQTLYVGPVEIQERAAEMLMMKENVSMQQQRRTDSVIVDTNSLTKRNSDNFEGQIIQQKHASVIVDSSKQQHQASATKSTVASQIQTKKNLTDVKDKSHGCISDKTSSVIIDQKNGGKLTNVKKSAFDSKQIADKTRPGTSITSDVKTNNNKKSENTNKVTAKERVGVSRNHNTSKSNVGLKNRNGSADLAQKQSKKVKEAITENDDYQKNPSPATSDSGIENCVDETQDTLR